MVDRFTRSRWIFGDKFQKLQDSKVLVCGCGGVGGVCIDALYRSGVGHITAIDCDKFDITNQNRQIGSENIGEYKTDVFARLYPGLKTLNLKLTPSVISEFDFSEFDLIIDCIDDIPAKVAIAKICSKRLLSSMGGAKRLDPTKIKVASIWKTTNDPFARKIRYELKKAGFKGDYKVVFSTEAPNCVNLGSFIGVTASFGLNLASLAVNRLIK
ncbi:MAG: ThiF family adenylyltransferase [Campylobacter lanienae]|uniref:Dinucleotide-utilizing enzyme, molybdopterin/thiamine biosynthesis family 1 n=1 Tax=Campylobacter lanienae NCTC 13004 TaxID=1031753 RepID=A0A1X9SL96_9BACT|nr:MULTISPECIES: ThiF family adenylyltransferase [Campylobacter]ARQ96990.1 dinucleotide-utilizing enzyme, molybdopterin/thiamine biosynthesis family 1 [Campylobacter lanienae NCTC 13004]MDY6056663.1 ThiF family adenylyltransferase [Campylobacter lanienae]MEE3712810.1 ThiF family adenylyltransferase [Campylobacter sp. CLAX-7218-21]